MPALSCKLHQFWLIKMFCDWIFMFYYCSSTYVVLYRIKNVCQVSRFAKFIVKLN